MAHESPIGLLIIRNAEKKTVRNDAFRFYQNAVDYLSQYAQARNWTKIGTDSYQTPTGYYVAVVMMVPEGVDLSKETYLDEQTEDKESAAS